MQVDTVLFDMGGTLEDIWYSDEVDKYILGRITEILDMPVESITNKNGKEFYEVIQSRYKEYRDFREETCIEVHPAMVWKDWILKDFSIPANKIFDNYEELACFWETEVINRKCRDGAEEMLGELKKRGIRLGIISNTGSFTQVYKSLDGYGLREYFEKIGLSCSYGIRKPHGFLFRDLLNQMECQESKTLYVGDTLTRDVAGAKNAGLYGSIQICSEFMKKNDKEQASGLKPDYIIHDLRIIPEIVDRINMS